MNKDIEDIHQAVREYEDSPDGYTLELALSLAEIVLCTLRNKGWSHCDLGLRAGMHPSFIERIVHADVNCTFEEAGKLLFALGVHAQIVELSTTSEDKND